MPTLSPQDRLQPALLDRLLDDEPEKISESREARLINVRRLRAAVLRDLSWLFNSVSPTPHELDHSMYPEVENSVIAYGLPPLSGTTASGVEVSELEARIRDAIIKFEPRLVPSSLDIRAVLSTKGVDHHNQVEIEIRGSLWSVPVPIEMLLRTDLDLESGEIHIRDLSS